MIRNRLIFLFLVQIALVLLISGAYLSFYLRDSLEQDLGAKLETVAQTVSVGLDATLISLLGPGDENTQTFQNLSKRIAEIQRTSQMNRILVMTPTGGIWLDSKQTPAIGTVYFQAGVNRTDIENVLSGKASSSPLFKGEDGNWYKTGYAPLVNRERIIGVVAVEGSAESLEIVNRVQNKLLHIGIIALLISLGLAVVMSHTLTKPLLLLQQSAKRIGQGRMNEKVEIKGKDETAFLAQTLEEMRQAILKRDEQQIAMLAGVAHEIRNPLGGIELFAGLLKEDVKDIQQKENADKILKEAKNLKQLVQNFLDFGKPINPKKEKCSLLFCWEETKHLLQDKLENIEIRINGDAEIFADPQHIKQVLLNLTINSVHAMSGQGKIELNISKESDIAELLFQDNGEGIPQEAQASIFDPFFSNKETGLGLGLAMSKNLVEQNNGSLDLISSEPGKTVFKLSIPRA